MTLEHERACGVAGAEAVPSDEAGTRRLERLAGGLQGTRADLFPGGCVAGEDLVAQVRSTADLCLCEVGVPCPGGTRP